MNEVRNTAWDVLVLDLTLPGVSGLDLLKDLRRERPSLPVLVLSMHPPDQFARRAMNAGAAGYLTKDSAPTELVKAVSEVIAGRRYLNPLVIEELVTHAQPDSERRQSRTLQIENRYLPLGSAGIAATSSRSIRAPGNSV